MKKLVMFIALAIGLVAPAQAQASSYLTVSFGRAQVGVVPSQKLCAAPAVVPMDEVLTYLQTRGLAATMAVQLSLTGETTERCTATIKYASWDDLKRWQSLYGTEAVSAGDIVADYRNLSDAQVLAHSCGTLQTFIDHGFTRANGLFASPSSWVTAHQITLLGSCFSFIRAYNNVKPTTLPAPAPYRAFTFSLTGGRCRASNLNSCSSMNIKNNRVYPDPDAIIAQFNATPDNTWLNFQAYRFVIGDNASPTTGWSCSSPDWHDHYTVQPEAFCWSDYQHIIDNLRPDFVSVDPKTIAEMQGR